MTFYYVQLKIETCVGPLMRDRIPHKCAQNTDSDVKSSSVGTRGARWQLFLHDIFIQWWNLSTKYAGNIQPYILF